MSLFDPSICDEASFLIEQGRVGNAARLLLHVTNPDHKSVQRLLGDIARRLRVRAQQQADNELWHLAWQSIELAGRCAELPDDGLALRDRIAQEGGRRQAKRVWQARRLVEAEQFGRRGRLKTAAALAAQV